ncbi:hypothetical protein [Streptomyces cyanogenus]|uniref:hypothetical protein n=1 Tax=Streptomyces cyanogenus TaxID=80860 RepID=UPI001FB795E3|nr:hypothetical protein [Streptomyces cyanogenus]
MQRELEDRLADLLLSGTLNPGDRVRVGAVDGRLDLQQVSAGTTEQDSNGGQSQA